MDKPANRLIKRKIANRATPYTKTRTTKLPAINFAANPGINPEMKAVDGQGTIALDNTIVGGGHSVLCNPIIQGTDRQNRTGRRVNIKSISVRMFIYTSAAAPAVVDDVFRFALVWDEQPTATAPQITDYWQDVSVSGATSSSPLSHNNLNNSARFRFLRTLTVPINTELQGTETNKGRSLVEWNVKCNLISQFNAGNAGTLADFTTGALYVVGWGYNSPIAVWSADVRVRVKFQDP